MANSPHNPMTLLESIAAMLDAYDPDAPRAVVVGHEEAPAAATRDADRTDESATHIPEPQPLADMRRVVSRASAVLECYAAERGCDVRLHLPDAPLLVQASAHHLEMAVVNLIRNAIDAHATIVTLLGELASDHVEVRVDDNGDGRTAQMAENWAATPYRCPAQTADFIARKIVELNGGQVQLLTRQQPGATVCLTLPRATTGAAS